ncbi:Protein BIG GRAIN 1-like A [Arabidopsis thaliana]|uniref:Protein BIG GRAIN 1-like A n=4 Tax=Arabidopsis TaxID=3701 RepID=BIG1A_ARATH|nr:SKI/DACH domain protein [Arabidopsis thaliana]Q9LVK2.1 RecName: Full=Protein BIG GRAIN 1-like A [Arabidopsis thaliana]KAG7625163.1 hypothetical protein ISN45_At03g014170 [Arabidopsis thaliana x Arabidopsis arenosa]KAG7631173.1 hypothetical protein ISN44_As03g014230 [Arabidopsis suecica]AEE75447.1 SKI/DACH domain protein [Arabidopsis thaliana]OAP03657.1 hypothetical protein AXX17_AT3G14480 [Arabidopsis thaliana]CAA0382360.1 unnamed protein product [Arabidopsis thaliana]|eukprot:NP_188014.1 SKI/DACH domain protein [Arabidopsis thaliana]
MEITWEKPKSSSHHRNPSFSSTLLDQIYRSIDDSSPPPPLESIKKKKHHHQQRNASLHEDREISPIYHRRSIAADFERSRRKTDFLRHSNSSSSDSSGFSSSESDSFHGRSKSSASPPSSSRQQPKPIRTSSVDHSSAVQKPKELGGFLRTKSKALKIYSDLKKVKQPISPGGRLATFLNSLFTNAATNPKKHKKTTTVAVVEEPHSSSTCSSASSFSRSCLSKTPSSSGKSKRSVRFCPVNVILDEDSSFTMPYAYNNERLYDNNEAKRVEEHRRVIQAAKDLLRTYHNKNKVTTTNINNVEEDDEDDAASCASSDLFELENLSAIGIERYREELPVYETTRLDNMNRVIATGLIV